MWPYENPTALILCRMCAANLTVCGSSENVQGPDHVWFFCSVPSAVLPYAAPAKKGSARGGHCWEGRLASRSLLPLPMACRACSPPTPSPPPPLPPSPSQWQPLSPSSTPNPSQPSPTPPSPQNYPHTQYHHPHHHHLHHYLHHLHPTCPKRSMLIYKPRKFSTTKTTTQLL